MYFSPLWRNVSGTRTIRKEPMREQDKMFSCTKEKCLSVFLTENLLSLKDSPYSLYITVCYNVSAPCIEIIFHLFFENVKSCVMNIEIIYLREQYAILFHVQK